MSGRRWQRPMGFWYFFLEVVVGNSCCPTGKMRARRAPKGQEVRALQFIVKEMEALWVCPVGKSTA